MHTSELLRAARVDRPKTTDGEEAIMTECCDTSCCTAECADGCTCC